MASQKLEKELKSDKNEIQKLSAQLNSQIKAANDKETELRALIYRNEDVIRKWTARTMSTTEEVVSANVEKPTIVTREVELIKYVLKEDEEKKMKLTERERKEIKKDLRFEFKKKIDELEANILAYQDLLMTKDAEISQLAERLRQSTSSCDLEKIFIEEFKKQIKDLEIQIAHLENRENYVGCDVKKDDGIR